MLGYITGFAEGQANDLLGRVAAALQAEGARVAGVVQVNEGARGAMDLQVLASLGLGGELVRISQSLGALSQGCRLDPDGLERAVGLVEARLAAGADLLIVNKFGKQEAAGRGFRPLIGAALAQGVPVLLSVGDGYLAAFDEFAGGMGRALAPVDADVLGFCREEMGR
jgi:nucleoside-triphosphatase THEP1